MLASKPNHPGHMSQIGLNLGARHARVLGFAKSYTARLDSTAMEQHDKDAIGAASISWSLLQAAMPNEVIDPVNLKLSEADLPRLATRNIGPGTVKFSLNIISTY